ncbi:hypothetical protein [Pseudomonas atacamensis]|uniref:hypothetical protein n=1 Tax=Pseudomonas atacamensis TaxID=2565368 RepID=UPI0019D12DEF|nr:hypothetical protein [Pseudomonas atacamensis]QSL90440.1 hypothetical protein JWU58_26750 [Pseudomonas atacamensis]
MCEPVEVRGGDEVVRDLLVLDRQVQEARKVLVIDGEKRPQLLAELNRSLEGLGLQCVAIGEGATIPTPADGACLGVAACKSFADIELLPVIELPVVIEELPSAAPPAAIEPVKPCEKPDMTKPINWKRGDVFTENPRFTLVHQRREWVLNTLDVADHESLRGVDVEIQAAGTDDSELMTIQQFMAGYVFVRRPQSTAE